MAEFDTGSGAGVLRIAAAVASQDIVNNTSTVSWYLALYCGNGSSYNFSPTYWSVGINGVGYSGTYTFDFRGTGGIVIASGSTVVTHNSDGTKTISVSGYSAYTGTAAIGGPISAGGSLTLPTIPRATTPTLSPTSGDTGSSYTITHTPASSSFYHDIAYSLDGGATFTNIATNVIGTTTTTNWTPAHTLFPSESTPTAVIRVITRDSSGGTIIGTKTVNLPLTVPSSIKPTISAVSWVDDQTSAPDMPTLMGGAGRFVQRWSKLKPTVTAAGAGGSTVTGSTVTQNGQATPSGTAFGLPIALSGSVPYSAVTLDTRGRSSDPYSNTVAVTAYNFPSLPTPTITRTSDAGGTTPSPVGTYLKITPTASVSSLVFSSSEKNLLEWQVRTRPVGGSWTTVQAWTNSTVSGNTWTTPYIIAGYLSSQEYEVEVSIRDLFGKNGYDATNTVKTLSMLVPSEFVFMDWDGDTGIGIGGYRRSTAMLDVHGDIHADNFLQSGNAVVDIADVATTTAKGIAELATSAETITGTDADRVVTPVGLASLTSTTSRRGLVRLATAAEVITGTDPDIAVSPLTVRGVAGLIPIIPTSVSVGSGSASVSSSGLVTATSCSHVTLNGIFSSSYLLYYIYIVSPFFSTDDYAYARFTQSGTATTTGNYWYGTTYRQGAVVGNLTNSTNQAAGINLGYWSTDGANGTELWVHDPLGAKPHIRHKGSYSVTGPHTDTWGSGAWNGGPTAFDGLRISDSGTLTKLITAKFKVFAYAA